LINTKLNCNNHRSKFRTTISSSPKPFFLFRGEARRFDKPGISTLERKKIITKLREINYYKKCFESLFPDTKPFDSDLNLRFIAFIQHNGFKTRLIDVTDSQYIALYFACNCYPDEDGFIYKFFGYDLSSLTNDLDQADIDSLFFNGDFPPHSYKWRQNPRPFLFYRDTNLFNIRARRQHGWFVFETEKYKGDRHFNKSQVRIEAMDKKEILFELKKLGIDDQFIWADLSLIAKTF